MQKVTAGHDNTDTLHRSWHRVLEWIPWSAEENTTLHRRLLALRWAAPVILLVLAVLHQMVLQVLWTWLPSAYHFWISVGLYALTGTVVAWLLLDWLAKKAAHQEQTESELRAAYDSLAKTHRQLLAVHEIGREVASAADMQQILELAVRAPIQLAGAKGSAVVTFDREGDRLKLDMAWGLSNQYLRGLRGRMEHGLPADRCHRCGHLSANLSGDCPLFVGMEDLAHQEGIQSLVCLPIARGDEREGIISAYFPSPDGPPDEQVQLLNIVATEIAVALDGVRWRTSQMATLYAVEHLDEAQYELGDLLEQILETTLAGWGAPRGAILLYDRVDGIWQAGVQRALGGGPSHPLFDVALRLAEDARSSGHPWIVPDAASYLEIVGDSPSFGSAASAPLLVGGDLVGALVMLADRPDHFRQRQTPFLQAVAHQAALAISNARLHAQVQRAAVLEERYRLSREMHDGLAQTLSALGWQIDRMKNLLSSSRLEELEHEVSLSRRMVREAYMDVREVIDGLRLDIDHEGGLASALEDYVADFEIRTGIQPSLKLEPDLPPLSSEAELQLLRIVQEALINVRKHASAGQVWVRLQTQDAGTSVALTVADDGQGFDPGLPRTRGHLGLATMRERAESQGGSLAVITGPGQGTRITAVLPCGQTAPQS